MWIYRLRRQIAAGLVFVLAGPITERAIASSLPAMNPQQTQGAFLAIDSPQASGTQSQSPKSVAPATPRAGSEQPPPGVTTPVGTAAAPAEPVTGVAATRPTGAAIAPAKQRRARAILIRVSIVLGAAVAVGTVVALSRSSPSRPN
jgi:hypothetical protein